MRRRTTLTGTALQELSACLKPLISSLGPADQEALQLVEFDGVTQVEAAERLGLSVSGMKSRVATCTTAPENGVGRVLPNRARPAWRHYQLRSAHRSVRHLPGIF